MREARFVHDLARACRDVAIVLAHLSSLASFDNGVHFQCRKHLVTHPVVVKRQSKVALDSVALGLADKVDPLMKTTAL